MPVLRDIWVKLGDLRDASNQLTTQETLLLVLVSGITVLIGRLVHSLYTALVVPRHLSHLPHLGPIDTIRILAKREGFLQANAALRELRTKKAIEQRIAKDANDPVLDRGVSWLFGHWVLEVSDPVDIKRILSEIGTRIFDLHEYLQVAETFPKMMLYEVNMHLNYMFFGENVAFSNSERWKHHRKVVSTAFKRGWPTYFFGKPTRSLIKELDAIAARKSGENTIDPTPWTHKFALDALAPVAFGNAINSLCDSNSELNQLYARIIHEAMDPFNAILPYWMSYLTARHHRTLQDMKTFNQYILKVIDTKLQDVKQRLAAGETPTANLYTSMTTWLQAGANHDVGNENDDRDLLDIMAEAVLQNNLSFTREELRTDTIIFLLAGHDTTGNTLSFAMYLLGMNKDIQERARQEVLDIMGQEGSNDSTWDQVSWPTNEQQAQMRYLTRVLKETLRMFPPVNAIPHRKTSKPVYLSDGTWLPTGSIISIDVMGSHRSRNWKNANVFDPDRWDAKEDHILQPTGEYGYSWIPFGGGPRICIGQQFAIVEMRTMLSMLLLRYDWKTIGDASALSGTPDTYPGILLHSHGIQIQLDRRP